MVLQSPDKDCKEVLAGQGARMRLKGEGFTADYWMQSGFVKSQEVGILSPSLHDCRRVWG